LGTLLLSILAWHHRYSHISAIRFDVLNPELLGMRKVVSEDPVRRAMKGMAEQAGTDWLDSEIRLSPEAAIAAGPWILDTDTTVKYLYGKQEGAVVGYNPRKHGRPSHNYHSCFTGNTRMALLVEVNQGNHRATLFAYRRFYITVIIIYYLCYHRDVMVFETFALASLRRKTLARLWRLLTPLPSMQIFLLSSLFQLMLPDSSACSIFLFIFMCSQYFLVVSLLYRCKPGWKRISSYD
jgi:hypothetical protein